MIRLPWRISALLLLLIAGLAILFSFYRLLPITRQRRVKQLWSRALLAASGIRLEVRHTQNRLPEKPALIALNHISWLDIFAINAVLPATFVAKSEIRQWPLVGWLVAGTGTVFIERGSRHAVHNANHRIGKRLAAGEPVAFFPEGTTSQGLDVLPFHTSLFAAAVRDDAPEERHVPLLPAAISYHRGQERTLIPAYVGDQSLVQSMAAILSASGISVRLQFLEMIDPVPADMTRHALAELARHRIRAAVQSPPLAAPSRLD